MRQRSIHETQSMITNARTSIKESGALKMISKLGKWDARDESEGWRLPEDTLFSQDLWSQTSFWLQSSFYFFIIFLVIASRFLHRIIIWVSILNRRQVSLAISLHHLLHYLNRLLVWHPRLLLVIIIRIPFPVIPSSGRTLLGKDSNSKRLLTAIRVTSTSTPEAVYLNSTSLSRQFEGNPCFQNEKENRQHEQRQFVSWTTKRLVVSLISRTFKNRSNKNSITGISRRHQRTVEILPQTSLSISRLP